MNMELYYLGHCLPCYFQGFSGDVLAVPVTSATTNRELRALLEAEYLAGDGPEYDNWKSAINRPFEGIQRGAWPRVGMASIAFDDLEPNEETDDAESVYAYFGIIRKD